jgi:tetratricopeptide (TPR) repeat protein
MQILRSLLVLVALATPAFAQSADSLIWQGRRLAYAGQYRDAIAVYTEGIAKYPNDARIYRHRGHRYITLREFDNAIRDFEKAAKLVEGKPDEIEPDGRPNKYNIPVGTLHHNIFYHLALAHYLKGDLKHALPVWRKTVAVSANDDALVSSSDWLYMTLRRLGKDKEAQQVLVPIKKEMRILENDAYHRRLLMYKGELPVDSLVGAAGDSIQIATYGYGVGNWYLYNGKRAEALEIFRRILKQANWSAFGYIAAEQEFERDKKR